MTRARGETLAMVLKALRENPRGLTTPQLSQLLGIAQTVLTVQMGNFRGAGHVESRGSRRKYTWFIDYADRCAAPVDAPRPARSIFAPPSTPLPQSAPGSSRVMTKAECCVAPDDFSPGAFMADWMRRIKTNEAP